MIVKRASRLCKKCWGKGILKKERSSSGTWHFLVCGCMTKSGRQEVVTQKQYNRRMIKIWGSL